ncbi:molybdopterin-guanine dinucleotide biosynthesis [Sesbania bispinosa]|nr:molybdopterin-guanine dinucleotide biosynthesis [Sesbania bispinosa]
MTRGEFGCDGYSKGTTMCLVAVTREAHKVTSLVECGGHYEIPTVVGLDHARREPKKRSMVLFHVERWWLDCQLVEAQLKSLAYHISQVAPEIFVLLERNWDVSVYHVF